MADDTLPRLFTEPVLVVQQKAKLIELAGEFSVFDQNGTQIGSVAEVGQSALKQAARFVSQLDQFMTHSFEIRDEFEQPVLVLVRPRKFMKSKFQLTRPDGTPVGEIAQKNRIGKIRFSLIAGGKEVATLNGENWRAWDFNVQDPAGKEIARISKQFAGFVAEVFTTADNYVATIAEPLEDPLRSLVVASALCIDTALKQEDRSVI
jgi:uncharacterized protein YxjI